MSVINNQTLERAKLLVKQDLGGIGDLPTELQNTIANIYYKIAQHLLNREDGETFPRSALLGKDLANGLRGFLREASFLAATRKALPDIIASFREDILRQKNAKDVDFVAFVLLCKFKYRIRNAMQKSLLRLKLECWLRKSSAHEMENLYQLFQ